MEMLGYLLRGVKDYDDDEEIARFLEKMIDREEGDVYKRQDIYSPAFHRKSLRPLSLLMPLPLSCSAS